MAVTPDYVREIFKGLENGDGAAFFTHVADDVDWTVMGTHPLAGGRRTFQRESGRRLVHALAQELAFRGSVKTAPEVEST